MATNVKPLILLLMNVAATAAIAGSPEPFFESAAWKDSPHTIETKFPGVDVAACAHIQELIYADRAVGCATHKLLSYKIGNIDFIASFFFTKVDQSLAEVAFFAIEPHQGEMAQLRRLCETVRDAMTKRYGVMRLTTEEPKPKVENGVPAYTAAWETPKLRSRFELDCIPMAGNEVVISAVVRPVMQGGS